MVQFAKIKLMRFQVFCPTTVTSATNGEFEILQTSTKTLVQRSCDELNCVLAFCKYNHSGDEVISACSNGLHSLTTSGHYKCKIADGSFSDVCLEDGVLVAVEVNKCEVQVFKLVSGKWAVQSVFKMKDGDKRLKTIHVQDRKVYVCYHWTHKIYVYTFDGVYLDKYGNAQGTDLGQFYGPYVCGTGCEGSLIVCDSCNHRIQVRNAQGVWSALKLEGITMVRDVMVVSGKLYVLWGAPNDTKLTMYDIRM